MSVNIWRFLLFISKVCLVYKNQVNIIGSLIFYACGDYVLISDMHYWNGIWLLSHCSKACKLMYAGFHMLAHLLYIHMPRLRLTFAVLMDLYLCGKVAFCTPYHLPEKNQVLFLGQIKILYDVLCYTNAVSCQQCRLVFIWPELKDFLFIFHHYYGWYNRNSMHQKQHYLDMLSLHWRKDIQQERLLNMHITEQQL